MLPPNILGSLNNLTRAGILDCGTASYVACGSSPYMYSPYRYRYSNLMSSYNPYMDIYYNPNNKGFYSMDPREDTFQRKRFVRRAINALLVLGGVYLGGKAFLGASKGVKAGAAAAGTGAKKRFKGYI